MDIIVCVKWAPDTSDADLEIASGGKDIKKDDLDYVINDWDRFAVEEAVRIKEKLGGKITVVSMAPEEAEEILRESLARGVDEAFMIWDDAFEGSDAFATASILAGCIKQRPYDLILTGTLADDDCGGQVPGMLAAMLGVPGATLVSALEFDSDKVKYRRELEGGLYALEEIDLPCLLAVATGLNEPRFVSIRAVRKVAAIDIPTIDLSGTGLDESNVGAVGSRVEVLGASMPPEGAGAEILKGSVEEAAGRLAEILKEKGGIS